MIATFVRVSAILLTVAACSSTPEQSALGTGGSGTGGSPTDLGAGGVDSGVTTSNVAGTATPGSQQDLEVNVGDRIFFGYDSATLDDTARQTLDRQAAWLQQYPATSISIEGHCDERGTREYNLALGERRAAAVQSYLAALSVDGGRIQTISYGSDRPVDPGHDESAYALNRRAVTIVNLTQ